MEEWQEEWEEFKQRQRIQAITMVDGFEDNAPHALPPIPADTMDREESWAVGERIVKRYDDSQQGRTILDQDVVRPKNKMFFWPEEFIYQCHRLSTINAPTYGTCERCWMAGPVGNECGPCHRNHKESHFFKTVVVNTHCMAANYRILDSLTLATILRRNKERARADRTTDQVREFGSALSTTAEEIMMQVHQTLMPGHRDQTDEEARVFSETCDYIQKVVKEMCMDVF